MLKQFTVVNPTVNPTRVQLGNSVLQKCIAKLLYARVMPGLGDTVGNERARYWSLRILQIIKKTHIMNKEEVNNYKYQQVHFCFWEDEVNPLQTG